MNGPIPRKTQSIKTHTKKIGAPNNPVSIKEIKSIFSNFQKQKVPSPQGSQVSSIKHLNKK